MRKSDDVTASGMLRWATDSTVGNWGSTSLGFTMRTGLAERSVHTFRCFRFMTMLLSSLGFPAKSGLVLEVILLSTSPSFGWYLSNAHAAHTVFRILIQQC